MVQLFYVPGPVKGSISYNKQEFITIIEPRFILFFSDCTHLALCGACPKKLPSLAMESSHKTPYIIPLLIQ